MKKILFILTFIPILALAQSQDQNYIKTTTYREESAGNPQVQVSYLDGLGRPIQQIAHQQSNSGKDIVTHIEYDAFGRQIKEFLPYANQAASLNYNSGASSDVMGFYNQPAYENTQNPFSEKKLEATPLDRVLRQTAPGAAWILHPTGGTDKSIKFEYLTNMEDEVKQYSANAVWNAGEKLYEANGLTEGSFYAQNRLYKTITKDENWTVFSGKNNTVEEFKDKDGRVILKRSYNAGNPHDTYYVYDQYGNLTYVVPPLVDTESTITQLVLDGLCYQYKYDNRNRLVEKKLPGKQWELIVYDKMNRVAFTGPAFNPWGTGEQGWMISKYDAFSRVVYTGWYNGHTATASNRKALQDLNNTASVLSESRGTGSIDNVPVNYTNTAFPTSGFKLLTVNYYDDYDFPGAPQPIPSDILQGGQSIFYNASIKPKGLPTGSWERILTTASEVFGKTSYTLYDNKARAVCMFTGDSYYGGYTVIESKIDFSGKTLFTETRHKRSTADLELVVKDIFTYTAQDRLLMHKQQIGQEEQLIVKNTYDDLGQLISKNVGGDTANPVGLQKIDYNYNIRGWLTGINNEQANDEAGILLGPGDLFGFKINYNKLEGEAIPDVKSLFNGNIAETLWMSSSDNILRKYSYQYDQLNRLLKGTYQKPNSETTLLNSYNEELNYDKNGNIQWLSRNGDRDTDSETIGSLKIDELTFSYHPDSPNQLVKVMDETAMLQGFGDDSDGLTDDEDDYVYDDNGNMRSDSNKNISNISYNHLNLPTKIQFSNSNFIEYIYTASGVKFQKKVRDFLGSGSAVTDYFNGFQYKEGVLKFFSHPEGYVNVTLGGQSGTTVFYNYVFNYTDHLGNVRLSYGIDPATQVLKIIEENHYYPFGLKHTNYNSDELMFQKEESGSISLKGPGPTAPVTSYKYKFGNKELQDELGLNLYDFGARNYDPAIGRWMNIDPKAETSRRFSPYVYANDNPVFFIDPDGMEAVAGIDPPKYKLNAIDYNKKTGNYTVKESVSVSNSTSKTVENPFGGSTQVTTSTNTTANFTTVINSKGEIVSKSNVVNETVTTSEKDANNVLDVGRVTDTKTSSSTDNSMTGPVASTISGNVNVMNETVVPLKNDQQNFKEMTPDMPGAADGPTGGWGRLGEAAVNQVRGTQTQYSDAITKSHRTGGLQSRDFTTGYTTFKTTLSSVAKKLNN